MSKTRHKQYLRRALTVLLLGMLAGAHCAGRDRFDVPTPSRHTLSNGMTVYVLEDRSLPTFRLSLIHPAGAAFETPQSRGLADITAETLRTGGTVTKTPMAVDTAISEASASLELSASQESADATLRVLREDRVAMLQLLAGILAQPRFDPTAFEIARRKALVQLRRSKEKPAGVASLYYPTLIYGPESPWAAVPTEEDLRALKVEQARQFYEQHYYPDRMILAVAGDVGTKELLQELEATLGRWQRPHAPPLKWPTITAQPPQTVFVPKVASQVALRLGHLGVERTDPDKFPILVANFILGGSGSMTSRLGAKIRSGQGQAYSIWSRYEFERVPGIFAMVAETEASQLAGVAPQMEQILSELHSHGATADEVTAAKAAILRSLWFQFERRYEIVRAWAQFEFWGYPRDYLNYFMKQIDKVDVAAVNRVLREDFRPDRLTRMIVGPQALWPQVQATHPQARQETW